MSCADLNGTDMINCLAQQRTAEINTLFFPAFAVAFMVVIVTVAFVIYNVMRMREGGL